MLVPNVVRSADEFIAGNSDMFSFASAVEGKEADATVGGIRALEIDENGMPRREKDHALGFDADRTGADLHRRREAMKVYSFDNVIITSPRCRTISSTSFST